MLGYYFKTFTELASLLVQLKTSCEPALVCLELQDKLILRMRRVEKKIRYWKSLVDQEPDAAEIVAEYQLIHRLFRSFGDAVAYHYIDRWDIKPLARNNPPGFISDKSGFRLESRMMRIACNMGCPALLADLTNCLRHGDLYCFGPDQPYPMIMEMKQGSKSKGKRARRQAKRINETFEYLNSGRTERDRYLVSRESVPRKIDHYAEEMHLLARKALVDGFAGERVSDSLWYAAFSYRSATEALESALLSFRKPILALINAEMYTNHLYPYYPISLVLHDPKTLASFYTGKLALLAMVDVATFEDVSNEAISKIRYVQESDNDCALEVDMPGIPAPIIVSRQMFSRIFLEFLDTSWFSETLASIRGPALDYVNGRM